MTNLTEELQRLNELDAKRTQGRWGCDSYGRGYDTKSYFYIDIYSELSGVLTDLAKVEWPEQNEQGSANANFIVAAPDAISLANKLHAENERLQKEVEHLTAEANAGRQAEKEANAENERFKALLVQAEKKLKEYKEQDWDLHGWRDKETEALLSELHAAGIGRG